MNFGRGCDSLIALSNFMKSCEEAHIYETLKIGLQGNTVWKVQEYWEKIGMKNQIYWNHSKQNKRKWKLQLINIFRRQQTDSQWNQRMPKWRDSNVE